MRVQVGSRSFHNSNDDVTDFASPPARMECAENRCSHHVRTEWKITQRCYQRSYYAGTCNVSTLTIHVCCMQARNRLEATMSGRTAAKGAHMHVSAQVNEFRYAVANVDRCRPFFVPCLDTAKPFYLRVRATSAPGQLQVLASCRQLGIYVRMYVCRC